MNRGKRFVIRMESDLFSQVAHRADKERISMSALIRKAVWAYLLYHEKQPHTNPYEGEGT